MKRKPTHAQGSMKTPYRKAPANHVVQTTDYLDVR